MDDNKINRFAHVYVDALGIEGERVRSQARDDIFVAYRTGMQPDWDDLEALADGYLREHDLRALLTLHDFSRDDVDQLLGFQGGRYPPDARRSAHRSPINIDALLTRDKP